MKRLIRLVAVVLVFGLAAGCGTPPADSSSRASESPGSASDDDTSAVQREQSAKPGALEHWVAAGAGSRTEFVSKDGEPKTTTAEFVNEGEGTEFSSVGSNGWLVGSASGWVHRLDAKGASQGQHRALFGGTGGLSVLISGGTIWFAGGDNGEVQEIDRNGQPIGTAQTVFSSSAVTAAALGGSQWLVGSNDGRLVRIKKSQLQIQTNSREQLTGNPRIVSIVRGPNKWYAFTETEYVEVTSAGSANPTSIATGRAVTTVHLDGDTVALGADDGAILVSKLSNLDSASWTSALGSNAVRALATNGQQWLAAGNGGRVRLLDSSGSPQGSTRKVAAGRDLAIAKPAPSGGWWVGLADGSAIQKLDGSLNPTSTSSSILGGARIRELVAYSDGLLAVGDNGKYRMLKPDGSPDGSVQTIKNFGNLNGAEWNGSNFMVVADGGETAMLNASGTVESTETRLGGGDLADVAWSGRYWLLATTSGTTQRYRPSGTKFRSPITTGINTVNAIEYNGDQWILVGEKDNKGAFALVNEDGSIQQSTTKISQVQGTLHAAGWNGREWLVGGSDGMVVRLDQGGSVITQGQNKGIREVLYGQTVRAIEFNGEIYLVGGGLGTIRKLEFDALPIRRGVAVDNFRTVRTLEWAEARGFAGGPCVTTEFCFTGACIGEKMPTAFCCESKCSAPCESCQGDVTGKSDGVCAPVPKGSQPPKRKRDKGNDCVESSENSCGTTGLCDGEGGCAFYGTDIQCKKPTCENGVRKGAGHCNGSGDCVVDNQQPCNPYASCEDDKPACIDSCNSGRDCVEGYVCVDNSCVDPNDQSDAGMGTDAGTGNSNNGGGSGGGCAAGGTDAPPLGSWVLVICGVAFAGRRRD